MLLLLMLLMLLLLLVIQRRVLAPLRVALHMPHFIECHWQSAADRAEVSGVRWWGGAHMLLLLRV